jgi:hypothetical protein
MGVIKHKGSKGTKDKVSSRFTLGFSLLADTFLSMIFHVLQMGAPGSYIS